MEKYVIIATIAFTAGCFAAAKVVTYLHDVELKIQEVYEYIDRRITIVHTHVDTAVKQASTDLKNVEKTTEKAL